MRQSNWISLCFLVLVFSAVLTAFAQQPVAQPYDLVLVNGRVMDPESNLDAVRNVGIRGGRIAEIRLLRFRAEPRLMQRVWLLLLVSLISTLTARPRRTTTLKRAME